MNPKFSVVLPVHNQADHVASIIERNRAALDGLGELYEQILVENGSTDTTLETCRSLADADERVRVIESSPGWGAAVIAGLNFASGEILCYTNSARTQPEDLALVLKYGAINDQTVVKASRKLRDSLTRRVGSVLYNFEARTLFGLAVWDINGTPKVFHSKLLSPLALSEQGDMIDLEVIVRCRTLQIPIVEVPIYAFERHGGKSTTNLRSAYGMYSGAMRIYWRQRVRSRTANAPAGKQVTHWMTADQK
jgi:glycosyltransferase involved in cell wall biosynthesis